MKIKLKQGRAQEFEKRAQFKAVSAGPDIFSLSKKRSSRTHMSNFPLEVKRRAKKDHHALRLSFIRISSSHHEIFVHWSAGGAASAPPACAPAKIMQKQSNKCVEAFKQVNLHNTLSSFRYSNFFAKNILFMT